jgi:hypothetical protein
MIEVLNLTESGQILLQVLLIGPDDGQRVADLVDEIAEDDHSEELDDDHNDDFELVLGGDVAVADGENGSRAEVERI